MKIKKYCRDLRTGRQYAEIGCTAAGIIDRRCVHQQNRSHTACCLLLQEGVVGSTIGRQHEECLLHIRRLHFFRTSPKLASILSIGGWNQSIDGEASKWRAHPTTF